MVLSFLGLPTLLVMKTCSEEKQNYQNSTMYPRSQKPRRKLLDVNRKGSHNQAGQGLKEEWDPLG